MNPLEVEMPRIQESSPHERHQHSTITASTYAGLNSRYVRIRKFAELTGYTDKAVRCKISEGVWREGWQWRRAPDGAILVDMVGYQQWVEGDKAQA